MDHLTCNFQRAHLRGRPDKDHKTTKEEYQDSNLVQNVKNLMKNASFTLDQAFNNLEVSDKDRVIVTKELQEESLRINSMQ